MAKYVPCGGDDTSPAGRILLTVNIAEMESTASAVTGVGPFWREGDCTFPYAAEITLNKDTIDGWSYLFLYGVMLHEIGHALGIG